MSQAQTVDQPTAARGRDTDRNTTSRAHLKHSNQLSLPQQDAHTTLRTLITRQGHNIVETPKFNGRKNK